MNILALVGSRNPQGQTARAVEAFLAGLHPSTESEKIFLPEANLKHCRQCEDNGWGLCRRQGRCVIKDDFAKIVEKARSASVLVVATPVYYSDLSESLRAFLDRLRRICTHDTGRASIAGKKAVGICVAGGGGGGAPKCCVNMEWTLSTTGFEVLDVFPVRRQNLESKESQLRLAGAWVEKTCTPPFGETAGTTGFARKRMRR